jgi:broad specificity phosphatase PhoE
MLHRKPFYFLRHGQTDWNVAGRFQGQTDIPLNDNGRAQATALNEQIAQLDLGMIYASHLSRAHDTAKLVNSSAGLLVEIMDEIKEVTIGEREGHPRGEWYVKWKAGELVIPGAETRADFRSRVTVGLNKALGKASVPLIISHGGVYGALEEVINITPKVSITNCMLLRLDPDPKSDSNWLVTVLSE